MLDLSLEQALKWYFAESEKNQGLKVTFHTLRLKDNLPHELNTAVYRIVQEALDNIMRHAGVKTAIVDVTVKGRNLLLEIRDEGKGFNPKRLADGCDGLAFMRERAAMVGGTLRVKSRLGAGTQVSAVFSVPPGASPPRPLC